MLLGEEADPSLQREVHLNLEALVVGECHPLCQIPNLRVLGSPKTMHLITPWKGNCLERNSLKENVPI